MESQRSIESENEEPAEVDDVLEGDIDVTSDGRIVKSKITQAPYTKSEMVVVWHWLENRYFDLYGHGKGSNVSYEKTATWVEFAEAVDSVEEGKNNRTVKKIWKKLDNMKGNGKSVLVIAFISFKSYTVILHDVVCWPMYSNGIAVRKFNRYKCMVMGMIRHLVYGVSLPVYGISLPVYGVSLPVYGVAAYH